MQSLDALAALSQETRLDVFRLLVKAGPAGLLAGNIAHRLDVRQNTMSTNLAVLARAGLIRSHREGRGVRYIANLEGMRDLLAFLMEDCCGGHSGVCEPLMEEIVCAYREREVMTDKMFNVLFLCTGNSARSILAEAILNREGQGRFRAYSAGSQPKDEVNPFALDLLTKLNHHTGFARSKSWDEFAQPGAPKMDFVFTVCDNAANEVCPVWPGQPMSAHWGVPDPAGVQGTDAERRLAFADAYRMLNNRISIFVNLPLASIDKLSLQNRLSEIGAMKDEPASEDA